MFITPITSLAGSPQRALASRVLWKGDHSRVDSLFGGFAVPERHLCE